MGSRCPQCRARAPLWWRVLGSYIAPERECGGCGGLLRITFSLWATFAFAAAVLIAVFVRSWVVTGIAAAVAIGLFFFGAHEVTLVKHGRGRCRECGYDLSGLGGAARCPECGEEFGPSGIARLENARAEAQRTQSDGG